MTGVVFALPYTPADADKVIAAAKDFTKSLTADLKMVSLGGLSEAGIINSQSRDVQKIKEFGGSVIAVPQSDYTETIKIELVEASNLDALRLIFGKDNIVEIKGTGANANVTVAVEVRHSDKPLNEWILATETVQGNKLRRQVVPKGQPTTVGDVSQVSNDIVKYDVTIEAFPYKGLNVVEYLSLGIPATSGDTDKSAGGDTDRPAREK
ncbi:hypothetical protein [Nocardia terpenica]|uniref:Uncharacterized protein n=1 Tax=Nocardia terpenica TaxID=455432 RepID=A0A6G9Z6V8_9NOCA|nr:hypothetical protein [Nocardia terpenica]QIS21258.1 hypothetical protein F6W96_25955 [Nocardia terpenica]